MTSDGIIPIGAGTQGGAEPLRRCGTTLILGTGRHVRVLTLPEVCGHRRLNQAWDACFGNDPDDELVVWWPADPPPPSRN